MHVWISANLPALLVLGCLVMFVFGHSTAQRMPTAAHNSEQPPHQKLPFALTSAPCVSSASTTTTCPLAAARWSGVFLRWNPPTQKQQRELSMRRRRGAARTLRVWACSCVFNFACEWVRGCMCVHVYLYNVCACVCVFACACLRV